MSERFHKAAKDGLIDVLKEATRREVNSKDVDGMTPVLWAAFEGRLDALRLLVGRGGDPDKSDQFGNTALHLSAAKGHMQCVDFLIKFGVNIYALDIDNHSAQDLAAINNRDEILRYLDAAAAHLEASDKKKAKAFREQAKKNSEKRAREYTKKQQKYEEESEMSGDGKPMSQRSSNIGFWKQKLWSGSQGNLKQAQREQMMHPSNTGNGTRFSALVGGTISGSRGAVQKKADALRAKQQMENDFKIGEVEEGGRRSVRSLQGLRRDSEILYVGTYDNAGPGKRGKIADVFDVDSLSNDEQENNEAKEKFGTFSRSMSQPDFLANANDTIAEDVMLQRKSGLFDRPMLGSLAFPRSVSAALSQLGSDQSSVESSSAANKKPKSQRVKPRAHLVISDTDSEASSSDDELQEDGLSPLERFLAAWSLDEHLPLFQKQQIDLDTLMLLTEADLKSLGLPLGPFRKLCIAIQERKNALTNPGPISDSRL